MKIRIGIILTRPASEKKKDELCNIQSTKRPWLKNINENKFIIRRGNKQCVAADVSIGKYIKWNWKGVEIDLIPPEEISTKRFKTNDINFLLIYDLLESYHTDQRRIFNKFEKTLKECDNVYPPYYYQKLINNKCLYINHLDKKNCPVIPTFCINTQTFQKFGYKKTMKMIDDKVKEKKWEKFIGKPVFGQESIGFKKFDKFTEKTVGKYIKNGFGKWPGIVFQKYIPGFDKQDPEIRMYFVGNKYQYSVITNDKTVRTPRDENGTQDVPDKEKLVKKAKETISKLPKIRMKNIELPRLLTRVDIACKPRFAKPWRINEIEFVPSLYIENVDSIPEINLGDQMVHIARTFINGLAKRKSK